MKNYTASVIFFISCGCFSYGQVKKSNYTPTFKEITAFYDSLDKKYENAKLSFEGKTDSGKPLSLFTISKGKADHPNKVVVLINNGIHPGEPDGINASMQLCADLLANEKKYGALLDKVIVCVIPVYNINGCLNRGCCSRANQDGPQEYGFRANARNLDLNRDFIKLDSENAKSFTKLFHRIKPHVLIDTHVSNGADYQHTYTYILSQQDKLSPILQPFYTVFETELQKRMKSMGHDIVPYVSTFKDTPDKGIEAFIESPRFATGFAALFNCFGVTVETHMLKPFDKRVKATFDGLQAMLMICMDKSQTIIDNKIAADKHTAKMNDLGLNYVIDTTRSTIIPFMGYQYTYPISNVTGLPILHYNTNKPVTWKITYYNHCKETRHVSKPRYYIVPQAWKEVITRLAMNGVEMMSLMRDSLVNVNAMYIDSIHFADHPYEGHFYHNYVRLRDEEQQVRLFAGDYIIPMGKATDRFVMEVLEPVSVDSYFRWNFFDEVLQQKEWFSDYVFEQRAEEILKQKPALKKEFEARKKSDPAFAANSWAQLYFIYSRSEYYEKSHNRYPVYRIEDVR